MQIPDILPMAIYRRWATKAKTRPAGLPPRKGQRRHCAYARRLRRHHLLQLRVPDSGLVIRGRLRVCSSSASASSGRRTKSMPQRLDRWTAGVSGPQCKCALPPHSIRHSSFLFRNSDKKRNQVSHASQFSDDPVTGEIVSPPPSAPILTPIQPCDRVFGRHVAPELN